ncbi:arylamine N-acetyltransferase family protein [Streptomyces purpureus]|uniref:arylamine N-acetyltransferase family protein n=1 Tax=Streptomyces purpureus TaxID=1951 RepID=UPI00037AA280|nr:arylamine N-acetyltransferase [Streptomyces purpureus]
MLDVEAYAAHLGLSGHLEPTLETLRALHKRHLMTVPFDNSRHVHKGAAVWDEAADADPQELFRHLVTEANGGVCHELNGLFRTLLRQIGFDVVILSAGIRGADQQFGPDLDHMLNGVTIDGELYLADVGYVGPSFTEPLHVGPGIQEQNGFRFRVVEEDGYQIVQRQGATGDWIAVFRFRPEARELTAWVGYAESLTSRDEWEWEGQQLSSTTVIRGRAFETGQKILIGRRYVVSENGAETFRAIIDKGEYAAIVKDIVGEAA